MHQHSQKAYSGAKTQGLIDNISFSNVTESTDGLMAKEDKQQVNKIGDLTLLNTTSNTDLVGAINEVDKHSSNNYINIKKIGAKRRWSY